MAEVNLENKIDQEFIEFTGPCFVTNSYSDAKYRASKKNCYNKGY